MEPYCPLRKQYCRVDCALYCQDDKCCAIKKIAIELIKLQGE